MAKLLATPRAFSRDAPSLPDVVHPQQIRLMKGARALPREVPTEFVSEAWGGGVFRLRGKRLEVLKMASQS